MLTDVELPCDGGDWRVTGLLKGDYHPAPLWRRRLATLFRWWPWLNYVLDRAKVVNTLEAYGENGEVLWRWRG